MSIFRQSTIAAGLTLVVLSFPMAATAASMITYTYDVFGQLVGVSSTAGRTVAYTYDAAANRTNLSATGAIALIAAPPQSGALQAAAPNRKVELNSGAQTSNIYVVQGEGVEEFNLGDSVGAQGSATRRALR
jgi:YD repeat-containing protein